MAATVTTAQKQWKTLKVGAGGWCTGFDQHADGTLVTWSDVNGPWLRNDSTSDWTLLINTSSMPVADLHIDNHSGVVSVAIAPSNSNIFYMFYYGRIYKSSNKGTTWERCSGWTRLSDIRSSSNAQTAQRYSGPLMAVDPVNANVVYVGTQDDGLFRTLDAGTTWTVRTDVPVGTGNETQHAGVNGVLFDPLSATTTVSGVTTTAKVWAASRGDGYYTSTDGGTTWTRPTGGPTTCVNRARFHINGTLWCFSYGDAPTELWRYAAGAWAQITASVNGQGGHSISCDPFDDDRIICATVGGTLQESLDCNAATPTFSTLWFGVQTLSSPEMPWHETAYGAIDGSYFNSNGDMRFHPTTQNKLMFSDGIGFWTTTLAPSFSSVTWTSMSKGIENIVAQQVTATTNGKLHLACQDRPIYTITDPDTYPSVYFLHPGGIDLASSVDYCYQDPNVACGAASQGVAGYTLNGGTSWSLISGYPSGWDANLGWGQILPLSATQWIWWPATHKRPYRTSDSGANWTGLTLPGITDDASVDGWPAFGDGSRFYHRDIIAADGATAGTVYAFSYSKGVFKSTDYGANWTLEYSGALLGGVNGYYQSGFKGVFGKAGHLWATGGKVTTNDALGYINYGDAPSGPFKRSVDGGVTWKTVNTSDVLEVYAFGFGKAATGADYPTVFIIGYVNGVQGIYYSTSATDTPSDPDILTWTKISDEFPMGQLCNPNQIDGDKLTFGKAYIGVGTNGFMYTPGSVYGRAFGLQF